MSSGRKELLRQTEKTLNDAFVNELSVVLGTYFGK